MLVAVSLKHLKAASASVPVRHGGNDHMIAALFDSFDYVSATIVSGSSWAQHAPCQNDAFPKSDLAGGSPDAWANVVPARDDRAVHSLFEMRPEEDRPPLSVATMERCTINLAPYQQICRRFLRRGRCRYGD